MTAFGICFIIACVLFVVAVVSVIVNVVVVWEYKCLLCEYEQAQKEIKFWEGQL